jgi:hypothetical protein
MYTDSMRDEGTTAFGERSKSLLGGDNAEDLVIVP